MQAIIKGNAALCAHQEQVTYRIGRKRIRAKHLFCGYLILTGPAAGVSGCLPDN